MKSARGRWTMRKWTTTLSISRWRMPSRIGQQNAGVAAAGVVVVCRDMRGTRSSGLEVMGRGKSKIHVHQRTTSMDHHGEARVGVEVRVEAGEGKVQGQARRGVQQEEIDLRELYDTNRVVPLSLSILRPDSPTSKCTILLVPIPSSARALFL